MQLQQIIQKSDNFTKPIFMIISPNKKYLAIKKTGDLFLYSSNFYFDIWDLNKQNLLMTIDGSPYRNSQFSHEETYFCQQLMHNSIESIELTNIHNGEKQYLELIVSEFRVFLHFCFQFQQNKLLILNFHNQEMFFYEKASKKNQILDVKFVNMDQCLICSTNAIYIFNLQRLQFQKQIYLKREIINNIQSYNFFLFSPVQDRYQILISYKALKLIRKLSIFEKFQIPLYKWQQIQAFIEINKNAHLLNFDIINSLNMQAQSFSVEYDGARIDDIILVNNFALILFGKKGEYQIRRINFNFS